MLQFAVPLCAARTWKSEHYFYEVDEPGSWCDDGWDFSPLEAGEGALAQLKEQIDFLRIRAENRRFHSAALPPTFL